MTTSVPLTTLPGVRGWLRRIHEDLGAGRSCYLLLPRAQTLGPDCVAHALLSELLHELGDFILLPADARIRSGIQASAVTARPAAPMWSGLAPLLDYDDGMSGFGVVNGTAVRAAPPTRPVTPAKSLADLLNRLAGQLTGSPTGGVLARLAGGAGGRTETRPIVIEAWREKTPSATVSFLRQLVATAKEAGLPPLRRPRALIVAAAEDLPADVPDQLARDGIAVHWWWGAVGRLDTATVVAVNRPPMTGMVGRRQLLETVIQATVTELSGPFLEVAAELARWDGNPETLLEALRRAAAETAEGDSVLPDRREVPAGRNRPTRLALLGWSAGLVDSWDGRVRWHPAYDLADPRTISTRVWLAQHHALLPRLDEVREDFTDVVRRRARIPLARLVEQYGPHSFGTPADPATGSGTGRTLTAMELGSMWAASLNGHIALNEVERRRLRVLWQSRNRLAHRNPLDAAQLHQLITELNA